MTLNTPNPSAFETLMNRRSVKAKDMQEPGPDRETLDQILTAAVRVPDHGKLAPWRFIVLEGDERCRLGELISTALVAEGQASEKVAEKMQGYATQGPTLVILISSPSDAKPIPVWEQELSAGAVGMSMLNAATALNVASQWLTGWASFSPTVAKGLGLTEKERIAGLFFFGTHPDNAPLERDRPALDDKVHFGFPGEAR